MSGTVTNSSSSRSSSSSSDGSCSRKNDMFPRPVGFVVEFFDPMARLVKTFVLTYFPDQKIQMVCAMTNKIFLSKTVIKDVAPNDLFIGNTVIVCARELSIVDYADDSTRRYFESLQARAFVMVLPSAMNSLGEIVSAVQRGDGGAVAAGEEGEREETAGVVIANLRMFRLEGRRRRPEYASLERVIPQNGTMVALEVITEARHGGFNALLGVVDRLRQTHGGGVFASNTPAEATEHTRYIFHEGDLSPAARVESADAGNGNTTTIPCSLCVVRPHVVRSGGLGAVLSFVVERGFKVAGMQMVSLGQVGAEQLLLPYRGVVSYHADAVRQLKSGPCVALQIEGGNDVVERFRESCGPADPEVARALYPDSIRALLGVQQATNAVHCTDLPEDGLLECQYIFGIVAKGRNGP